MIKPPHAPKPIIPKKTKGRTVSSIPPPSEMCHSYSQPHSFEDRRCGFEGYGVRCEHFDVGAFFRERMGWERGMDGAEWDGWVK